MDAKQKNATLGDQVVDGETGQAPGIDNGIMRADAQAATREKEAHADLMRAHAELMMAQARKTDMETERIKKQLKE
jgi:hypothetical protein